MSGWLVDPTTREPLPAVPSDPRVGRGGLPRSRAAHWRIERDESGYPVRMWFSFCGDPTCCPPFDPETAR